MNGFSLSIGASGAPLHAAAHSHHPWPDVTHAAQEAAWRDAARLLDRKWGHVFGSVIPEAQSHVARVLNLPDPSSVVFGPNTHSFLLRLLSCLPRERIPRILTTGSEFMSFSRQMARLEEEKAVSVTRVRTEPFDSFEQRFFDEIARGSFDLIYISQVFFDSSFRVDPAFVADAARDPHTLVVIDGYHGFMAIPTNLRACAERIFYLAGGYKYAMSGEGVCFLHCPRDYCPRPRDTGWYAGFSALETGSAGVPYAQNGSRFFGATFDVSGLYRFNAVQNWLIDRGMTVAGMLEQVRELERTFLAELDRLQSPINRSLLLVADEQRRGRFLTFRSEHAGAIAARLAEESIVVDHRGDRLRIGFGIYHSQNDAVILAKALHRALSH